MKLPMTPTPGNLSNLVEIMHHVATDFCDGTHPDSLPHPKNLAAKELWNGVTGLRRAISDYNDGKGYCDPKPPYPNRRYSVDGWENMIRNELHAFNCKGNAYITRMSECLIKTMGLVNAFQGDGPPQLSLYRGQCEAGWPVVSSIGRKVPKGFKRSGPEVTQFELEAMAKFQSQVENNDELRVEIFGSTGEMLAFEDGRWWPLKQHYYDDKETGGSRLIDFTASPLCGLYFACIDWDGKINDKVDGELLVLTEPTGRRFGDKNYIKELPNYDEDIDDAAGDNIPNYFGLERHPDVVRTVLSHHENQRSLAQDGYFIFNGKFDEPLEEWYGQKPFSFIIPKENKKYIARELCRVGYTPRKIVRGPKGREADKTLQLILGG